MNQSTTSVADEANAWQKMKTDSPEQARRLLDEIELGADVADALNGGREVTAAEPIKSVVKALEYAQAFQDIAAFLAANPVLAKRASVHPERVLVSVTTADDPGAFIVEAARCGQAAGARVEEYATAEYGGIKIHFGPVCVQVYAKAELVCSQVVVGRVPDVRHMLIVGLDGIRREAAVGQAVAQ
ncbi:hypothetical protein [Streptosporangium sp. NPDC051022]|uniref:hypothetical protein n=1 Tax=Streptosporangium sp. NPDC051022 TaxID=3155752 RepID=UPI00342660BF